MDPSEQEAGVIITTPQTEVFCVGFEVMKSSIFCLLVFLMCQSTQQLYNKQINTTVLAFVYCVEILLHVSTLLGHQAITT
jgi:hypothetical protein